MEYVISDKMKNVSGSMVRELFKLASDPAIIKFGGGNPSAESFPVSDIASITAEAFQNRSTAMLQYGVSEGYAPLRETLKKHLASFKIDFEDNEIMIVSGAQQAADLTAKVLCNEGDTVICEDPAFVGCLNAFRTYGVNLVGVPVKSDGMDMELLEKALKENKNVR
ncbi:MAG: aminotransferase class I/II-fold pyridoxal phosphate-dependent enzyme, partial [Oscillospiraceae bacterium]